MLVIGEVLKELPSFLNTCLFFFLNLANHQKPFLFHRELEGILLVTH